MEKLFAGSNRSAIYRIELQANVQVMDESWFAFEYDIQNMAIIIFKYSAKSLVRWF